MQAFEHDRVFLSLKLHGGQVDVAGYRRYRPGDLIKGTVELEAREDIRCRDVELHLEWHTEGKGTRDGAVVERKVLANDSLRARQAVGDQFVFQLPMQPWSYVGHFITIVWKLTVVVDIPMARDIRLSQPLIVAPEDASGSGVETAGEA